MEESLGRGRKCSHPSSWQVQQEQQRQSKNSSWRFLSWTSCYLLEMGTAGAEVHQPLISRSNVHRELAVTVTCAPLLRALNSSDTFLRTLRIRRLATLGSSFKLTYGTGSSGSGDLRVLPLLFGLVIFRQTEGKSLSKPAIGCCRSDIALAVRIRRV